MVKRSMISVVFWTLVCASASGQEPGGLHDPTAPSGQADPGSADAGAALGYHLTGTLVSPSGRVAIINGRLSREGDRVDGAEIISIEAGVVHMRAGSAEISVSLGSHSATNRSSDGKIRISRDPTSRPALAVTKPEPAAVEAPSPIPTPSATDRHERYGPVQRGETLSGIAKRYVSGGITLNQMMIALFEANPSAFSGNINVLHEGVVLRIPDGEDFHGGAPAFATAEVARQEADWKDNHARHTRAIEQPREPNYGPVRRGETLSAISEYVLIEGVTRDQMMIALFRANPRAFTGNINVLHEGAVLRIPDGDELHDQRPETATAEVLRQTDAWRAGSWRQARLTLAPAEAPGSDPPQLTGVMVPAQGLEPRT